MQSEMTNRSWKKNVKKVLTTNELNEKLKENKSLYPVNFLSFISSISGAICINDFNPNYKTFITILSGAMLLISISSGIMIINNKKEIKKLKLQRKQKYKQIINDTKKIKNIEDKELVLVKKYNLQTINTK